MITYQADVRLRRPRVVLAPEAILPSAAARSEWHPWAQMATALADASTTLHQPGLLGPAVADTAIFTPHLLTATGPDNLWGPHASPGIEAFFGRDVILGIRPSDFEDSSLTEDSWPRMPVVTHVIEALGSEIHVIFAIDAPPVEHKDVADLAPEREEEGAAIPLHEGKSLWTARVNARSRVRSGDRIELGVDTRNLHFFDPDSGLAIGVRQAAEPMH